MCPLSPRPGQASASGARRREGARATVYYIALHSQVSASSGLGQGRKSYRKGAQFSPHHTCYCIASRLFISSAWWVPNCGFCHRLHVLVLQEVTRWLIVWHTSSPLARRPQAWSAGIRPKVLCCLDPRAWQAAFEGRAGWLKLDRVCSSCGNVVYPRPPNGGAACQVTYCRLLSSILCSLCSNTHRWRMRKSTV